jgi:hypothetical protein
MADPAPKSAAIDDLIRDLTGIDRVKAIVGDTCGFCKGPATKFNDALSAKEYRISGLCQTCQNHVFGGYDEEDDA